MNAGSFWHVVSDELGFFVRCEASDLVTPEWNTPVAWAVDVGVAAGTRQQMQTPATVLADVRPLVHLGMGAARSHRSPGRINQMRQKSASNRRTMASVTFRSLSSSGAGARSEC